MNLEDLVINILDLKKQNSNSNISYLETEIDQLIYQLYGLTNEEIDIVESSFSEIAITESGTEMSIG